MFKLICAGVCIAVACFALGHASVASKVAAIEAEYNVLKAKVKTDFAAVWGSTEVAAIKGFFAKIEKMF